MLNVQKTSNKGRQQNQGERSSKLFNLRSRWTDFDNHLIDFLKFNTNFILYKMNTINSNLIAIFLKNNC